MLTLYHIEKVGRLMNQTSGVSGDYGSASPNAKSRRGIVVDYRELPNGDVTLVRREEKESKLVSK